MEGDWNTDLTRKTSLFTKSLVRFCDSEGLTCVNFVSNVQQFTYVSDMNGSKSTIDHFIISNILLNSVNQMLEIMLIIIQITYQLLCTCISMFLLRK